MSLKTLVTVNRASAAFVVLEPVGFPAPHWHLNSSEFDDCVSVKATTSIVSPNGVWNEFEVSAGEAVFIPQGCFHGIANAGTEPMNFNVVFNAGEEIAIELGNSVGGLPSDVVAASLAVPLSEAAKFPKIRNQAARVLSPY